MTILNIESTPNPNALKFTLDARLVSSGSRSFDSADSVGDDPLAAALFSLDGVQSVFYMERFVTISKAPGTPWNELEPQIRETIELVAAPLAVGGPSGQDADAADEPATDDADMLRQINDLLDESVRPALAGDGGGLEVLGYENHTLTISYQGACGSCPSSIQGTLRAIENLLRMSLDPTIKVETASQEHRFL